MSEVADKKRDTSFKAVVKIGGKQYLVAVGDTFYVEKIDSQPNSTAVFSDVYALFKGSSALEELGNPVCGKKVEARVIETIKGKKIIVQKYKPKTRYRRRIGHRQLLTKIKITAII